MIEVKISFSSVTQLLEFFGASAVAGTNAQQAVRVDTDKAQPDPKPVKTAKTAKAADTLPFVESNNGAAAPATQPIAASTPAAQTVTTIEMPYPPIGDKIAQLVAKDRGAAVAILASFNDANGQPCKKGPAVVPADYPALSAMLDAALADGQLS